MCGHIGVAGSMSLSDEQAFRDLLTVDVIRGPHSTGICGVSKWKGVDIIKKPLLPTDLFTLKAVEDLFYRNNYLLMGHNRWATQGAINAVNAHPFDFPSVVGTHNGTLVSQNLLPDFQDFEVDSENVFHSIQEIGIDDTWKRLHGAASLVWFDKDMDSINFLRNSERPMYITFTADRQAMFYASEAWMLEGVLAKNGIKHSDIFDTVVNTHYSMVIPPRLEPFDKTQARVLTPYEPPKKQWVGHHGQMTTGNVITLGSKTDTDDTQTTDGGAFEVGEMVYFTLDPIPLSHNLNEKPFILATDASAGHAIKLFTSRDSWIRSNLRCDDVDTQMYQGVHNGTSADGAICIQDNSVFTIAEDEEVPNNFDEDAEEAVLALTDPAWNSEAREYMLEVIDNSHGCAWCADDLFPSPEHVIIDDRTIICKHCKKNDDVKEYLLSTN